MRETRHAGSTQTVGLGAAAGNSTAAAKGGVMGDGRCAVGDEGVWLLCVLCVRGVAAGGRSVAMEALESLVAQQRAAGRHGDAERSLGGEGGGSIFR